MIGIGIGRIALLLSSFRTREIIIKIIMNWVGIGMMMIEIGIGRIAVVLSSFKTREIMMIGMVIGNEDSALWFNGVMEEMQCNRTLYQAKLPKGL